MSTVCWNIPPPNSINNIVNEKVAHIDNVVFGVLFLANSVILKISIQSMKHNIRVSSLARPVGICDKVLES